MRTLDVAWPIDPRFHKRAYVRNVGSFVRMRALDVASTKIAVSRPRLRGLKRTAQLFLERLARRLECIVIRIRRNVHRRPKANTHRAKRQRKDKPIPRIETAQRGKPTANRDDWCTRRLRQLDDPWLADMARPARPVRRDASIAPAAHRLPQPDQTRHRPA